MITYDAQGQRLSTEYARLMAAYLARDFGNSWRDFTCVMRPEMLVDWEATPQPVMDFAGRGPVPTISTTFMGLRLMRSTLIPTGTILFVDMLGNQEAQVINIGLSIFCARCGQPTANAIWCGNCLVDMASNHQSVTVSPMPKVPRRIKPSSE